MFVFDSFCKNNDSLSENNFDALLERIKKNDLNIVDLDIRCDLNSEQFVSLFKVLKKNNIVESLTLRGKNFKCDLSNENIYSALSHLLKNNENLKGLTLYHTDIEDDGIKSITKALETNDTLKHFKVCGHNIGIRGELSLIKLLAQDTPLKDVVIDYPNMSEDGRLVLLSQYEHLPTLNLDISNSNYSKFCNPITSLKDTTEISLFSRNNKENNPISRAIRKKEFEINKLVAMLESENFSPDFIEITKDFCLKNFVSIDKEIAEHYTSLKNAYQKAIDACKLDKDKLDKLDLDYENKNLELLKKYNDNQANTESFFTEIEKDISSENKEVKQREGEVSLKLKYSIPLTFEAIVENTEKEIKISAPKKLNINKDLQGTKYLAEWTQQLQEKQYDYVVISVGSHGKLGQQIPSFVDGLGKVAILNVDQYFSAEEMETTSGSDNVSVNYLRAKIQVADRCMLLTLAQRQNYKPDSNTIKQEELADNICALTDAGQKVVLISHISMIAPRIFFKEVLTNENIMDNYGSKFLFMHSYFEEKPTILCNKSFIESMLKPNMKTRAVQNKYILTSKQMPQNEEDLKDLIVSDKIEDLYARVANYEKDSYPCTEGYVCQKLSLVNGDHIISLMGSEDTYNTDGV